MEACDSWPFHYERRAKDFRQALAYGNCAANSSTSRVPSRYPYARAPIAVSR